jgi:hypothetical protein
MDRRTLWLSSVGLGLLLAPKSALSTEPTVEGTTSSPVDTFECTAIENEKNGVRFATIPSRPDSPTPDPPILLWASQEFSKSGYTPERRCKEVTRRLSTAIAEVGGKPADLRLTMGKINNLSVLCYVNQTEISCNSRNVLFTLSKRNQADSSRIMAEMLKFSVTGEGTSLKE